MAYRMASMDVDADFTGVDTPAPPPHVETQISIMTVAETPIALQKQKTRESITDVYRCRLFHFHFTLLAFHQAAFKFLFFSLSCSALIPTCLQWPRMTPWTGQRHIISIMHSWIFFFCCANNAVTLNLVSFVQNKHMGEEMGNFIYF